MYASATAAKTLLLKSCFFYFKLCRFYNNGPLQPAIPVKQNRRTEEQKWHWDMTNKGNLYVFSLSCAIATLRSPAGKFCTTGYG